ncbi:hypothetical protein EH228_04475 [Erwinia endophytica]|uniref:hypothetical protein n=1 Tax=Erwinia endophytica TaxID=1563158 RepID=UPI001266051E|nr:hypothetical protein [Erwinia endophytica]KAB8312940.1 hypothetical protein EH228_04475 [Erwinia endophytica]
MQNLKQLLNWLKSLFIKSKEATTMTDTTAADTTATTAETVTVTTEPVVTTTETADSEPVLSDLERFAAKLKELVETAGSQAHAYFDDLVELAKKLI